MREPKFLKKYRPNVGVCLFNKVGQVWVGHRKISKSSQEALELQYVWQMPQGGVDNGETVSQAAFRELEEETNATSVRLLTLTPGWMAYDFPENYKPHKVRKYKGQRQKWAAMLFEGKDSEFKLDAHKQVEFTSWRWAELHELPEMVIPFKKGVYEEVVRSFTPLATFIKENQ